MKERIAKLVEKHLAAATELRHELHRIPEIAGKEFRTSRLLREKLAGLPLQVRPPYLETDVVALLNADRGGRNITLRADIDALPIMEKTGSPWTSTNPGLMHACGHDGHMAMLYGAICVLAELGDELHDGSVRFVFQPGEEAVAMARKLVAAGALDDPPADFCAAVHGWPGVRHCCVSTREGAVMAAAVHWSLTIKGRGGHGSMPEKAINPMHSAARIIERLRMECPPVCSVCHMASGFNQNIIPDTALLEGTTRSLDESTGERIEKAFRTIVDEVCREEGTDYDLDYENLYPVCASSSQGFAIARKVTEKYLGTDRFVPMEKSSMSSEDFAYFLKKAPGVYCHIGLGDHVPLHRENFEFDDKLISTGMTFFAGLAVEFLQR